MLFAANLAACNEKIKSKAQKKNKLYNKPRLSQNKIYNH